MKLFSGVYAGRRVLLTGHTGFKGSWLALWLQELGACVTGISLPPETLPNHWELLDLHLDDHRIDIRDSGKLQKVFVETQPDLVFHLAAQPLVRRSYRDPLETWATNVLGTANVLEACRAALSVRAIVVVTTDKCYENREWQVGYSEDDRLGGHDPYSASKAAAELVCASYLRAFFVEQYSPLLATARAGNVVGGGDWSEDRLIPDLVRATEKGRSLEIRSPSATRPWQHVLDSLSAYLLLGQKLLEGERKFSHPWNFGPDQAGSCCVVDVLKKMSQHWPDLCWHATDARQAHEATLLSLDCAKAHNQLQWRPVWDLDITLAKTAEWYQSWLKEQQVISRQQINDYVAAAQGVNAVWANS